jgi:hypothetical protein
MSRRYADGYSISQEKTMSEKQAKDQAEAADDTATIRSTSEGKPLSEQDLDAVTGGAARRGPGTQTEDDVYVG